MKTCEISRADSAGRAKNYVHYLSVLKCAGMLAVIGIHVLNAPVTYWHEHFTSVELFFDFFVKNVLICWAVPVFVMTSGALFLGRRTEIRKMWGKYILRLMLSLLTFGTLFALMEIVFDARTFAPAMILSALRRMLAGESWSHLWFVYMCIGLYIITPPLQRMLGAVDGGSLKYLLAVLVVFTCLVPAVDGITGVKFGVYIPASGIWIFYYLMGYALHNELIRIDTRMCAAFIVIGVTWCSLGQLLPDMRDFYGAQLKYAGPGGVIGVMMSLAVFSLVKSKCAETTDFLDTAVNPLTFGVYVVHAFFINLMYKVLHFTPERVNAFLMWAVVYTVTLFFSLGAVWLMRKIPFVRKRIL